MRLFFCFKYNHQSRRPKIVQRIVFVVKGLIDNTKLVKVTLNSIEVSLIPSVIRFSQSHRSKKVLLRSDIWTKVVGQFNVLVNQLLMPSAEQIVRKKGPKSKQWSQNDEKTWRREREKGRKGKEIVWKYMGCVISMLTGKIPFQPLNQLTKTLLRLMCNRIAKLINIFIWLYWHHFTLHVHISLEPIRSLARSLLHSHRRLILLSGRDLLWLHKSAVLSFNYWFWTRFARFPRAPLTKCSFFFLRSFVRSFFTLLPTDIHTLIHSINILVWVAVKAQKSFYLYQ